MHSCGNLAPLCTEDCMGEQATLEFHYSFVDVLLHKLVQYNNFKMLRHTLYITYQSWADLDSTFSYFPPIFGLTTHSPFSRSLPAVTHVLLFQTAYKVTSRRCRFAWRLSAKNTIVYYCSLHWLNGRKGLTLLWLFAVIYIFALWFLWNF